MKELICAMLRHKWRQVGSNDSAFDWWRCSRCKLFKRTVKLPPRHLNCRCEMRLVKETSKMGNTVIGQCKELEKELRRLRDTTVCELAKTVAAAWLAVRTTVHRCKRKENR